MEFNDNGKKMMVNVDMDNTLTNGEKFWEEEPTPNQEMVDKVTELYRQGNHIIIWTARQWNMAPETVGWLITHQVPFHGIMMGKGGAAMYVDDKAIKPEELEV